MSHSHVPVTHTVSRCKRKKEEMRGTRGPGAVSQKGLVSQGKTLSLRKPLGGFKLLRDTLKIISVL